MVSPRAADSQTRNLNITSFWRRTVATPDASSSRRCAVHWGKAAASLSTLRSNRRGSRNSRRGCPSLPSGSRTSSVGSGICFPSFGTTCTNLRSLGRTSLKAVLPALVPEMSYDGMAVANGQDAGLAWESLLSGGLDESERGKTKKALLDYCKQDTLALVRIREMLLAI